MNITIHFLIKRKGPSQIIDCFGNIMDTGIHFVASRADLSWALSRASAWEAMHLFDQIICIFILMFSNLEKHGSWSKCLSFTLLSFASVESKTPQKQIFVDHAKRVNLTQEWSVPIPFSLIQLVLVFPQLKHQKHELLHSMATKSYTRLVIRL